MMDFAWTVSQNKASLPSVALLRCLASVMEKVIDAQLSMLFTPHPITSEPEMRMRYLKQKQALYPDLWPLGKRWNDTLLPRQRGLAINGINWDKDRMARSCPPWLPPLTDYKADNASAIKYTHTLCPMHTLNADQSLFGGTLRLSRQLFPKPSSFTLGGERSSLRCYPISPCTPHGLPLTGTCSCICSTGSGSTF